MAGRTQDSRYTPAQGRYGAPGVRFPTPNTEDLVIVEDVSITDENYVALLPGTPHPIQANATLVKETPGRSNGRERNVTRIYATTQAGQEAYNAAIQYALESDTHPIYVRAFTVPYDAYTKATKGAPLTAVTGLRLTAQGSGYKAPVTVTLSGDGTGATAKAQIQRGKIVAIRLTNAGTGYSSAPTVTITATTGTGATATAELQPSNAVLVSEKTEPLGDGTLGPIFIRVVQVYETLPGVQLQSYSFDRDRAAGAATVTTTQIILPTPDNTTLPDLSDTVLDASIEAIDALHSKVTIRTLIGSQPTVTDWVYDDRLQAHIKIQKTIVDADSVTAPTLTTGVITEYKAIDEAIAVRIVSTFPNETTLAGIETSYPTTEDHSFPRMLTSATWNYAVAVSGGGTLAFDLALESHYEDGYSGPCVATIHEYRTYDPVAKLASLDASLRSVTMFMPEAYTIYGGWAYTSTSQAIARMLTFPIAESIHDALDIDVVGAPSGTHKGLASLTATSPSLTEFLAMDTMVKRITVDLYRGGIYLIRVTQLTIPHA